MSLFRKFFLNNEGLWESRTPVLELVYSRPPLSFDLAKAIAERWYLEGLEPTEPEVSLESHWQDGKHLLLEIQWGKHKVELAGLQVPLPSLVLERAVLPTLWRADFKELMLSHKANIILKYEGTEPNAIEQYLALYRVALLFETEYLLGVVNEPAWTCHPGLVVRNLLSPEMIPVVRDSPPLLYWTGYLQMDLLDFRWAFSRGNYLFGVPDFVFLLDDTEMDGLAIQNLFHEVFTYTYFEQKPLRPGDILTIENGHSFEMVELEDELAELRGQGETFILHPVTDEEVELAMANQQMLQE